MLDMLDRKLSYTVITLDDNKQEDHYDGQN